MIEGDLRFGAFVPRVPQAYRDEAADYDDGGDGGGGGSSAAAKGGGLKRRRRARGEQDEVKKEAAVNAPHSHDDDDDDDDDDCEGYCAIGPQWTSLELLSVIPYNHDTSIFRFKLPRPHMKLNLPVTAHMLVRAPGREHMDRGGGGAAVRPYTSVSPPDQMGSFDVMIKLYREWGMKECDQQSAHKVFLYAKTDHSYKPPGAVSAYVHSLNVGDKLEFKFVSPTCLGRIRYPFPDDVASITMIAVGAGVAPMIRILRRLLDVDGDDSEAEDGNDTNGLRHGVRTVRLLYGVRTVRDVLLRSQLDAWHDAHNPRFRVRYCVGSRWSNVHFASKTQHATGPPLPKGYESIPDDRKALGWVDGEKIQKYGASGPDDTGHKVFVCGLPGVYLSLAGPRSDVTLGKDSQLYKLGYRDGQVVKF